MQGVHGKLNKGLWLQSSTRQEDDSFHQELGLTFKEETSQMLRLEHDFIRCWNSDNSESRSAILVKFWNIVLEKDGENQLDRSCEKRRNINLLKPNDIHICRTATLTTRRYILNIYSTNIHTDYFKHAA